MLAQNLYGVSGVANKLTGSLCGYLAHCPMVGQRHNRKHSAAGIKAVEALSAAGRIVEIPYTPEYGSGWACIDALKPITPFYDSLNAALCRQRVKHEQMIDSSQQALKKINKLLGLS